MSYINFLKSIEIDEEEANKKWAFFDTINSQYTIDIWASFGKYIEPDGWVANDLYIYHLHNFHVNGEWNDYNLERLANEYKFNEWVIYGKTLFVISHPKAPTNRKKLEITLLPLIEEENAGKTVLINLKNKYGRPLGGIEVPAYKMIEFEYILKEIYREQAHVINSGFTFYKEEIQLWINNEYKVNPQLSSFSEWYIQNKLNENRIPFNITKPDENNNVNIHFDFSPLLQIKKETLKVDLIEYCKYIRDDNKRINIELSQQELKNNYVLNDNLLFNAIISACQELQADKHFWNTDENTRNTSIRKLLNAGGYVVSDQSLQGESSSSMNKSTKKSSGELDLLIRTPEVPSRQWVICEALNLNSVVKSKIDEHIKKLEENYDPLGLKVKYLLIYADIDKGFLNFGKKYKKYLYNYVFAFPRTVDIETIDTAYTNLIVYKTAHIREGKPVYLYHVLVKIPKKST